MVALPVTKLGALILKTASKPISRRLASYAHTSPTFRNVCTVTGRANNWVYYQFNRTVRDSAAKLKEIDEEKAVQRGSELLADIFVLSVGAGVVIYEYEKNRQSKNTEIDEIQAALQDHEDRLKKLELTE